MTKNPFKGIAVPFSSRHVEGQRDTRPAKRMRWRLRLHGTKFKDSPYIPPQFS